MLAPALQSLYDARRVDREGLRARLATVGSLATGLATGQARAVLRALAPRAPAPPITVHSALLAEPYDCLRDPAVRHVSGFFGPIERMARAAGAAIEFLPVDFHGGARLFATGDPPQAIAVLVSPPDAEGYCSFGLHAGATCEPLRAAGRDPARLAIAEINPHLPRVAGVAEHGANRVHLSEVDCLIEDDTPLMAIPYAEPSAEERAIAAHVGTLVREGATLQFGIGGIPNAVAELLSAAPIGDFGIHTEMVSDGIMRLHTAGKVTNRKGVFDGVSVATFALGTPELYRWLDGNPLVRLLPVGVTNDVGVMARTRRFTSINGALAVDVHGQVVADTIAGRQYSGIGGSETFVRGAREAPEGRSILCLRSTYVADGRRHSTIVRALPAGSLVTTPRHQVQYVVTEHGVALLAGRTDGERAAALTAVAAPEFRGTLARPK